MKTKNFKLLFTSLTYLFIATVIVSCDNSSTDTSTNTVAEHTDIASLPLPEEIEVPTVKVLMSLPDFSLINQDRKAIGNKNLFGQVWVANFIFTECKGSCPMQTQAMKRLQQDLKSHNQWKNIQLVSISVDPNTDTPDALSKYISKQNVELEHWSFLTGKRDEIWSLSKDGFKLPVNEDAANNKMPIMHSQQFVLIDWEGRVRGYYDSLDTPSIGDLKRDLDIVLAERKLFPEGVMDVAWMTTREAAQRKTTASSNVFSNFNFTDRVKESGITFQHKMVDDVGRDYKAVHYDHGNGLAIADVDGDGLEDIYFTTQLGTNELWRNLGDGDFSNITDQAGLRVEEGVGVAAAFADIDNDGDQDLYTTSVRTGNMMFENDGKGHFKNITEHSGLGVKAHSSGVIFFDYDKDGLLDLFVTNVGVYTTDEITNITRYSREKGHEVTDKKYYVGFKDGFAGHLKTERTEQSILFRNMGDNKFEDVSKATGLMDTSWSGDAITIDGNNDGWTDLYVLNMQGHDEYYENNKGKSFIRKSRDVFQKTSWGAMGGSVFDFNNDGYQDIFVTDMHSDMSKEIGPKDEKLKSDMQFSESFLLSGGNSLYGNTFFLNNGNNSFTEISDKIDAENYWPWGLSVGDLNSDGYEDAFLTSSMNYPFRYTANSLMLNNGGKSFIDAEFVVGVEPRKDGHIMPWFQLECSGADEGRQMCAKEEGRKVVWGALGSRSSIIFDVDQDGDQDIVTLEFNTPPMVLISDLTEKTKVNYLKVKLEGTKSNRNGIGAVVTVHAGNDTYTHVNHGKSGYLGQSIYPMYFGLGNHNKVDKVVVKWPSGGTQTVTDTMNASKTLKITE